MIWAALLSTAIFLAVVLWGDKPSRRALIACAAGILAMQVFKLANMGDLIWLCSTSVWVSIGVYILKVNGRDTAACALLLIASGLCYAVGRALGIPFYTGNPVLRFADLFGIVAMLLAGWRGVRITRGCGLGRYILGVCGRSFGNSAFNSSSGQEQRLGKRNV